MIAKYDIVGFNKMDEKINEPITKFGGQPIWISEEKWPMSMGWKDRKMMFVGQIAIEKGKLGNEKNLVVYIFITHPKSNTDNFFDPDIAEWNGGENAVIIQSFKNNYTKITNYEEGPTLFDEEDQKYEYVPILKEGYDPEFLTNEEYRKLDSVQQEEYFDSIDTNKIGGTPNFFREDAFPEGEWILLLQLKCNFLPFVLRAGSMAVLYVFISKDFQRAGLLIQD